MPSGLAAFIRENMEREDTSTLVPQESRRSKTGYTNIIEVGGKYQARWQLKGDGRGGVRKRKQHPLPGIFDTAVEAAIYLSYVKKTGVESFLNEDGSWYTKERKSRAGKPAVPEPAVQVVPPQPGPAFAMATYITGIRPLPIATGSPLPMPQLGYTSPFPMRM